MKYRRHHWNDTAVTRFEKNKQTKDDLVGRAINRLRFKTHIWKAGADNDRVFIMVNDVRKFAGLEPMTRKMFDDGMQWCHIFSDDYRSALIEFRALCWGDW